MLLGYYRSLGGHTTPHCGNMKAGRQDADFEKKNANMDVCVFFTFQPTATAVGCPSPFEPLKDGFATGTRPLGFEKKIAVVI